MRAKCHLKEQMNYAGTQIRNYSKNFVQTGHETQMHRVEKSIYSLYHKFSKKIINKSWSPSLIFLIEIVF